MAANKEMLQKRYERIRSRFYTLSAATTKDGRKKNPYPAIIEKLADEFCYSEKTIENICATNTVLKK